MWQVVSHQFNLQLPCNQWTSLHVFVLQFLTLKMACSSSWPIFPLVSSLCLVDMQEGLYCLDTSHFWAWGIAVSFPNLLSGHYLLFNFLFCIGAQQIYNVVIVSDDSEGTQPQTHMYPFSSWSVSLTIVSFVFQKSYSWRDHVNLEPYDCVFGIFKEVLHLLSVKTLFAVLLPAEFGFHR